MKHTTTTPPVALQPLLSPLNGPTLGGLPQAQDHVPLSEILDAALRILEETEGAWNQEARNADNIRQATHREQSPA